MPRTLAGTWVPVEDAEHALGEVEAAFAPSLRSVPPLFRGIAEDRVRSSLRPPSRIVVRLSEDRVHVTLAADRVAEIDGAVGETARATGVADGTVVRLTRESGWLSIRYDHGTSSLRQLLSTERDGTRLHVDFQVSDARLGAPVQYRIDYVRDAGSVRSP